MAAAARISSRSSSAASPNGFAASTRNTALIPAHSLFTTRLELRPIAWEAVEAITQERRLSGWADDFPAEGDVVVARMLERAGPSASVATFGHYHLVERDSGLVVGGIGFLGVPHAGVVEMGYGVVPSRQGRGYATEALDGLLRFAWEADPTLESVVAGTDGDNVASQRVLEKTGFTLESTNPADTTRLYRILRVPS